MHRPLSPLLLCLLSACSLTGPTPTPTPSLGPLTATYRATDLGTTVGQLDWPALVSTVRPGDHGEAVKAVQTLIPGGVTVDGSFGPLTEAAVREFQRMFAPPSDGVVGPNTWHALTVPIFD